MALTDIDFSEGDKQGFLVEVDLGTLSSPVDVLSEPGSVMYPLVEVDGATSEGDIFIIND